MSCPVYLIAAACRNGGIGYKGDLPWRLKKEMAYFTKMTSATKDERRKNAVIMGRKTWFSIPPKHRPLEGRINIVMSASLSSVPGADYLVHSRDEALDLVCKPPLCDQIEKVFVIGGEAIYKNFLETPNCQKIYLTQIDKEYECDTFFPDIDMDKFQETSDPDVPQEEQEENGIKYKYKVYERKG